MARKVTWAEPALDDLERIAEYIALDDRGAASRLVRRVFDRVKGLRAHPHKGPKPSELEGLPYRCLAVPPCRVFYRVTKTTISVLHVMRGEQLLRADLILDRDVDE